MPISVYFDRSEGELAVLVEEDGAQRTVPLCRLPVDAREGEWLVEAAEGYTVDADKTRRQRQRILDLQRKLRGQ